MHKFLTFLGEAFPPPQKKSPSPPEGGQKSPFDNKGGPQKPKPAFGKKPMLGKKAPAPAVKGDDEGNDQAAGFGGDGENDNNDALMAMQQAEQEKEEEEEAQRQQKAAIEDAERQKVKALRAKADDEVAAALLDKYNDDTDEVEFYPDMLSFQQFTDKSKDGKKNGTSAEDHGSTPTVPTDGKKVKKDKDDDQRDEDDQDDAPVPEDDADDRKAEKRDTKLGKEPKKVKLKKRG